MVAGSLQHLATKEVRGRTVSVEVSRSGVLVQRGLEVPGRLERLPGGMVPAGRALRIIAQRRRARRSVLVRPSTPTEGSTRAS
jgi:hypothetical protein